MVSWAMSIISPSHPLDFPIVSRLDHARVFFKLWKDPETVLCWEQSASCTKRLCDVPGAAGKCWEKMVIFIVPNKNGGWPKRNNGLALKNGCQVPSRGLPIKERGTHRVWKNYGNWKSEARECDHKAWVQQTTWVFFYPYLFYQCRFNKSQHQHGSGVRIPHQI